MGRVGRHFFKVRLRNKKNLTVEKSSSNFQMEELSINWFTLHRQQPRLSVDLLKENSHTQRQACLTITRRVVTSVVLCIVSYHTLDK